MRVINAVGQACPMPVILTKRALKESTGKDILVQVDNEIATQNLHKMAEQLRLQANIAKISESLYEVQISSSEEAVGTAKGKGMTTSQPAPAAEAQSEEAGYVVILHSDRIGEGQKELGQP